VKEEDFAGVEGEREDVEEERQASPIPSPTESFWSGLGTVGQLSSSSQMPSLSVSVCFYPK